MYYAYKERNHGIFAKLMDMTIVKNYKVFKFKMLSSFSASTRKLNFL